MCVYAMFTAVGEYMYFCLAFSVLALQSGSGVHAKNMFLTILVYLMWWITQTGHLLGRLKLKLGDQNSQLKEPQEN